MNVLAKLCLLASVLLAAGCAQMRPLPPAGCTLTAYRLLPSDFDPQLAIAGRAPQGSLDAAIGDRFARSRQLLSASENKQVLVLSGGGENGSFGAGLLRKSAPLPAYDVVTGVSTGSLQSTFAFLANQPVPNDRTYPAYMYRQPSIGAPAQSNLQDLELAYAISMEGDLMAVKSPAIHLIRRGTIATFAPLRATLIGLISHDTMLAVAAEAEKGRSLFVGVTNLDDGYGYAIDLTALAEDAKRTGSIDEARGCYADALIASSSVPPGVPPVTLVTANGTSRDMYMDGGARFGVFFDQLRLAQSLAGHADMTLIVNNSLYQQPWTKDGKRIATWSALTYPLRAVDIMQNQVYRLSIDDAERWSVANGTLKMAFQSNEALRVLKTPPEDWVYDGKTCAAYAAIDAAAHPVEFQPKYMRCMIDYGEHRGLSDPWNKVLSRHRRTG